MSIFGAIQRALTPPGTSEANRDRARKGNAQKVGVDLLGEIQPSLMESAKLFNSTFGQQKQAYKNIFDLASPGGVGRRVSGVRSQLLNEARGQARMLKSRYANTGGIGLEQGFQIQGENEANSQANDLFSYYNSPKGQAELSDIILQLSKRFPGLDIYQALDAIIQGRAAPQVGASPIQSIGAAAGLFG